MRSTPRSLHARALSSLPHLTPRTTPHIHIHSNDSPTTAIANSTLKTYQSSQTRDSTNSTSHTHRRPSNNGSRPSSRHRPSITTYLALGAQLPGCRRLLGPDCNYPQAIGFSKVFVSNTQQTPFMRKAAVIRDQQPKQQRPYLTSDAPWVKRKIWSILYAVMDLLRNPAYAVPLLLNVTGSVWFFLLIGQAG